MLTKEDVETLVQFRDKERINLELKSIRLITAGNKDSKSKLAAGIVALANKNGGRLILGVNDDGTFDGKYTGNTDEIKEYIHNICRDNVSPSINFDIQFLETEAWDIFIIFVPKRRNIPHAYIPKRDGHEIFERIYYTRTPNGKKLMTDIELEWMFKNQEVSEYSSSFRLSLEFDKQLTLIGGNTPFYEGSYYVNDLIYNLSEADRTIVKQNFTIFIVELFPYLILGPLCSIYSNSWYIGMHEEFDRTSSGPMITNIPVESDTISISEIPVEGISIIDKLSWNFKEHIKNNFRDSESLKVPLNTTINISYDRHFAKIKFQNSKFTFKISIGMLSGGGGLHRMNPSYEVMLERQSSFAQKYAVENHLYFDGAGTTKANFEFLEYDIDEFKKIEHYYNSLKKNIDRIWNYETVIKGMSHKDIRVMHSKVDDILDNTIKAYNSIKENLSDKS